MISKYIFGFNNWKKYYATLSYENKKKIWVFLNTSDGKQLFLRDYKDWLSIQEYIENNNLNILSIGLRFKSNSIEVDTTNTDGVYLIRSIKGEFGSSTKHCFTIGKVVGNNVEKTMWLTPELIEEGSHVDDKKECFTEAIVYHGKEKS